MLTIPRGILKPWAWLASVTRSSISREVTTVSGRWWPRPVIMARAGEVIALSPVSDELLVGVQTDRAVELGDHRVVAADEQQLDELSVADVLAHGGQVGVGHVVVARRESGQPQHGPLPVGEAGGVERARSQRLELLVGGSGHAGEVL